MTLADHLIDQTAPADTTAESWKVDDERAAEWAAKKLRQAQRRIADVKAEADDQRRLIDEWEAQHTKAEQDTVDRMSGLLTDWLRRLRDADHNVKSVKLPSATVRSRTSSGRVEVTDEAAFTAWATETGRVDLLLVSPSKSAIKKSAQSTGDGHLVDVDTGEVLPGVGLTGGVVSYSVEVNG